MTRPFLTNILLCLTLANIHVAHAQVSIPPLDAGRQIERTLLMSDFSEIGARNSFERHAVAQNVTECFMPQFKSRASDIFAATWVKALTERELTEGARLASNPSVSRIRAYTIANLRNLRTEIALSPQNENPKVVMTLAMHKLGDNQQDQAAIDAFFMWDKQTRSKFNVYVPQFTGELADVFQNLITKCRQKPTKGRSETLTTQAKQ